MKSEKFPDGSTFIDERLEIIFNVLLFLFLTWCFYQFFMTDGGLFSEWFRELAAKPHRYRKEYRLETIISMAMALIFQFNIFMTIAVLKSTTYPRFVRPVVSLVVWFLPILGALLVFQTVVRTGSKKIRTIQKGRFYSRP